MFSKTNKQTTTTTRAAAAAATTTKTERKNHAKMIGFMQFPHCSVVILSYLFCIIRKLFGILQLNELRGCAHYKGGKTWIFDAKQFIIFFSYLNSFLELQLYLTHSLFLPLFHSSISTFLNSSFFILVSESAALFAVFFFIMLLSVLLNDHYFFFVG